MLAFSYRFHGHNSLKYVYKTGAIARTSLFTLKYTQNHRRDKPRVAIVVSKKVQKSAVARNRIRRRLYEIVRSYISGIDMAYDMVIIVTSASVKDMSHDDLSKLVLTEFVKAGIYKNK